MVYSTIEILSSAHKTQKAMMMYPGSRVRGHGKLRKGKAGSREAGGGENSGQGAAQLL